MFVLYVVLIRNMEDGLAELAAQHYDLLVLDMQFPLEKGAEVDTEAGMKLLARLQEQKNEIPVIICSSDRLRIDGVIGCIFYNPSRDLNFDFKDLLAQI